MFMRPVVSTPLAMIPKVLLDQILALYVPVAPDLTVLDRSTCLDPNAAKLPVAVLKEDQFVGSS